MAKSLITSDLTQLLLDFQPSVDRSIILSKVRTHDLFKITLDTKNPRLAFKAAWFLEHYLMDNKLIRDEFRLEIIDIFYQSSNWSVLRSLSKLLMIILEDKILIQENSMEQILNKSFDMLENNECPIAVRCNIYDILLNSCTSQDWLRQELERLLYLEMEKRPSPAINGRAKKVLKKLKRIS